MNNWVKFNDYYSICKNTCMIKSHARKHLFGLSVRRVPERILAVGSNGYVKIHGKSVKPSNVYKDTFGIEWED